MVLDCFAEDAREYGRRIGVKNPTAQAGIFGFLVVGKASSMPFAVAVEHPTQIKENQQLPHSHSPRALAPGCHFEHHSLQKWQFSPAISSACWSRSVPKVQDSVRVSATTGEPQGEGALVAHCLLKLAVIGIEKKEKGDDHDYRCQGNSLL